MSFWPISSLSVKVSENYWHPQMLSFATSYKISLIANYFTSKYLVHYSMMIQKGQNDYTVSTLITKIIYRPSSQTYKDQNKILGYFKRPHYLQNL